MTTAKEYPALEVTLVRVRPLKEGQAPGKTKALALVVLNDQLQLTGLRVIEGVNGLFVAYPNDPFFKGEDYRSVYFPVTRELRERIEEAVLAEYHVKTEPALQAQGAAG